jgi:beta-fructofuranosidase
MMTAHPDIAQAMRAVQEAVALVEGDPLRPGYHFRPPARWMNDPNGTFYHQGYYHVFYQHNPYVADWGPMYWGHARSRDLVHWEHLPIALWPSNEAGESSCWSGWAGLDGEGQPLAIYTSVAYRETPQGREYARPFEQWAARSDGELEVWEKHPANPVLELSRDGQPGFADEWRDPFIFREGGRTFLVIGKAGPGTPLYEARDQSLTRWDYRGLMSEISSECPNFFRLGERFVYLHSPHAAVRYLVGDFSLETLRFTPEAEGVLDPGRVDGNGFYASNVAFDDRGRCILFGWIYGFAEGQEWQGCLSLPRLLTVGHDGHPRQQPVTELTALREQEVRRGPQALSEGVTELPELAGDMLELDLTLKPGPGGRCGLVVRRSAEGERGALIAWDGESLTVAEATVPFDLQGEALRLHCFLDKSLVEVFVNGGRTCISRVLKVEEQDQGVGLLCEGRGAELVELRGWRLRGVW